jgi:cathepsin L
MDVRAVSRIADEDAMLLSFDAFVRKHQRSFRVGSFEYNRRKMIYERRVQEISRHNADPQRFWTASVNHLSDLTDEEFQVRLGWRHGGGGRSLEGDGGLRGGASLLDITPPESVSWMNLTMAKMVRDQGACGSCWAMATAATLEAHYEITHGEHRSFSAQELVDCVSNPLNCGGQGGCEGATVELAMDWAIYNSLKTLEDSPYLAASTRCTSKPFRTTAAQQGSLDSDGRLLSLKEPVRRSTSLASGNGNDGDVIMAMGTEILGLVGFTTLPTNKYMPLLEALMKGPVGVSVAASGWSSYSSGVFNDCDPTVNHAVILMGYGKDNDKKYYHIRNSWGDTWGENGFIRLLRTDDEEAACSTDHSPKDGVGCDGGPSQVTVCGSCGILYDSVVPAFKNRDLRHAEAPDHLAPVRTEAIFRQRRTTTRYEISPSARGRNSPL